MERFCLKLLGVIITCYLLLITCPRNVQAQQQFNITYDTTYTLDQKGTAQVAQFITIQNKETQYYAGSYTLTVVGKKPKNISVTGDGQSGKTSKQTPLPYQTQERDEEADIIVTFPEALVGREKARTFTISYLVDNTALKNGEVWDITIPKLANSESVESYRLTLNIPSSYGNPAFVSPQPQLRKSTSTYQTFIFEKGDLVKAGVVSSFGEFQIYNFSVSYHIENPNPQKGEITIALPPDTAFQRVYYESIDPQPAKISLDDDGNWIAVYLLEPNERQDIVANFEAQVFAKPQTYYPLIKATDSPYYLSGTELWQTTDPEITKIASGEKSIKNIYDFVINTLNYDYSKVGANAERLGAIQSINSPNNAICTEYTDLFVTLTRAYGVPAREINGYAYTENPKLQPLSLVADLLHSWPEYWDASLNLWKPVDPTWEDTTGGIDFFNKFDLSHVVFSIHGKDYKYPIPAGAYKSATSGQKDIKVEFGSLPFQKDPQSSLAIGQTPFLELPFRPIKRTFYLINTGKVALYNIPTFISAEGIEIVSSNSPNINFLAPQTKVDISVAFKTSFIPSFKPMKLKIIAGGEYLEYDIPATQVYGIQILAIFTILLTVVLFAVFSLHLVPRTLKRLKKK